MSERATELAKQAIEIADGANWARTGLTKHRNIDWPQRLDDLLDEVASLSIDERMSVLAKLHIDHELIELRLVSIRSAIQARAEADLARTLARSGTCVAVVGVALTLATVFVGVVQLLNT